MHNNDAFNNSTGYHVHDQFAPMIISSSSLKKIIKIKVYSKRGAVEGNTPSLEPTSTLRPSTTVPFRASLALSASAAEPNVTNPKPCGPPQSPIEAEQANNSYHSLFICFFVMKLRATAAFKISSSPQMLTFFPQRNKCS